jgi:hypothetical protein
MITTIPTIIRRPAPTAGSISAAASPACTCPA